MTKIPEYFTGIHISKGPIAQGKSILSQDKKIISSRLSDEQHKHKQMSWYLYSFFERTCDRGNCCPCEDNKILMVGKNCFPAIIIAQNPYEELL